MHFPAFEERHAAHIRPEMLALSKREAPVTLAEYLELRANSYERHILNPRLDDEALAYAVEHNLKNCCQPGVAPYGSYDEALVGFYAPEMLRRWRAGRGLRSEVTAASEPSCSSVGDDPALVSVGQKIEFIPLPPSEHARATLLAGGPLALAAFMKDEPDAAQRIIDAQRTNDDAPYTDAEIEELAQFGYEKGGPAKWEDASWILRQEVITYVRDALNENDRPWHAGSPALYKSAAALMRRAEARGRAAYAGTLPITRSEAELFRDALHHLPGFVDDHEMSGAVLRKIRAFLNGVKS